ncbi:MAG: hypothetical protein A3B96_02790 [Candidatus Spechtbacteria bacterium RIFCSPHIGHO2_02_FULL_43_15b]|uniref:Uncharacterized protein n=1 Tax=Candidatus Spechtbacteria bacterium RIFCSPHIGHO2_01_FULL_43_30 TaxID=1802158 RepID=A0A1G2H6Q3_9BACT|nr:MAG: hypothetical protein A2827_02945 [Candidatus Spechtbacteria bacterium RIFCSPHIGHO2_01_FULL_43_30]OGZ60224.1 MAG: hypothetical protein A3B96_02790 [Candidatus Spechtbacteria bacterium RIFCSPHIGHO2_02_FULL_43_15b]
MTNLSSDDLNDVANYILPRIIRHLEENFPRIFRKLTMAERLKFTTTEWDPAAKKLAADLEWKLAEIILKKSSSYL